LNLLVWLFLFGVICYSLPGCKENHTGSDADKVSDADNTKGFYANHAGVFSAYKEEWLELASGKKISLSELKDSLVLVNYWAVWCAPCRQEIPELNWLHAEGKVTVLGIDFDRTQGTALQSAIAQMGITFPVLTMASSAQLRLGWPEVLPATLVLRNLEIVQVLQGPQSRHSLTNVIRKAVKQSE
jgi:thiol-disulfide isomerase/thioredoxin